MSNPGGQLSKEAAKENTNAAKKSKAPPKSQAAPIATPTGTTGRTIFDRPLADARAAVQEKASEAIHSAENDSDEADGNDLERDDDQPETQVPPNLLIDHKLPKRTKNKRGRPIVKLLDKMLQPCHHVNQPTKEIQRCSGNNCGTTFVNRNTNRAAKHVRNCLSCPAVLRKEAREYLANKAPSAKVPAQSLVTKGKLTVVNNEEGGNKVIATKKRKLSSDDNDMTRAEKDQIWYEEIHRLGKEQRFKMLDIAILKFFCVCGIPTSVASHDAWRDIFRIGVRGYKAADRNKLEDEQIISEAERIRQLQIDYLRTQENITVSCDGGTARNHDAYWTVHMSTMERKVYLMETREATNVSHTGEWIVQLVLEVSSVILKQN